jgi:hypothetical protein
MEKDYLLRLLKGKIIIIILMQLLQKEIKEEKPPKD